MGGREAALFFCLFVGLTNLTNVTNLTNPTNLTNLTNPTNRHEVYEVHERHEPPRIYIPPLPLLLKSALSCLPQV